MHGPSDCIGYARILAVDLGKFNSVLCSYDPATAVHQFLTVQTTPQAVHDLLVKHGTQDPSQTLVVFETCDAAGWVYDQSVALGFAVAVANPNNEAWRWTRVKRKTDRDDALKLARMAARNELPTVHMPPPPQRQKRRLVHHRRALVQRRTAIKNQIRSIFSQQGQLLPRGNKCWTKPGIEQLRKEARPMHSCPVDELWRGRLHVELALLKQLGSQVNQVERKLEALGKDDEQVKRLTAVKGVGTHLAMAVLTHLDDPHRFKTAAQVSSYAGLVPKQIESGTMKRVGKITRRGPSLLRGMLVEVAWMVYRYNAWAKAFVDRVSRGMKQRRKIAIVALARKLLVKLWAMLRDGSEWRDPDQSKGQDGGGPPAVVRCSPPEDTRPVTALSSVAAG